MPTSKLRVETVAMHMLKKCCITNSLDGLENIIFWKHMDASESKLKRDSEKVYFKYVKKF